MRPLSGPCCGKVEGDSEEGCWSRGHGFQRVRHQDGALALARLIRNRDASAAGMLLRLVGLICILG